MPVDVPPLGLCSWHLEHSDLRVPAVTIFEGTALCEACNSDAHNQADEESTGLDRIQAAAEAHAGNMLTWIRSRTPGVPSDEASDPEHTGTAQNSPDQS